MNQEQAESYIGKTVYTIYYGEIIITPHVVSGAFEEHGHNSSTYQLITEDGSSLFNFKSSYEEATQSLVKHYEMRVNVASDNLKEALALVGL